MEAILKQTIEHSFILDTQKKKKKKKKKHECQLPDTHMREYDTTEFCLFGILQKSQ